MVKASEIRVGNCIYHHTFDIDTGSQLLKETIVTPDIIKEISIRKSTTNYSYIPLSHEIIEQYGFQYRDEYGGFVNRNHIIYECGESGEFWWEFSPHHTNDRMCQLELHHLHQLQNACFLYDGEELLLDPPVECAFPTSSTSPAT